MLKPLAYNSILNPGGTLGCASAGLSTTRARLIARAFDPGGGKSWTVILRMTPGASLVQSPIAALPVRTASFSAAEATTAAKLKLTATTVTWKQTRTSLRYAIIVWNRLSYAVRVDC